MCGCTYTHPCILALSPLNDREKTHRVCETLGDGEFWRWPKLEQIPGALIIYGFFLRFHLKGKGQRDNQKCDLGLQRTEVLPWLRGAFTLYQWFSTWESHTNSSSTARSLVKNAHSWAQPRFTNSKDLGLDLAVSRKSSQWFGTCSNLRTITLTQWTKKGRKVPHHILGKKKSWDEWKMVASMFMLSFQEY